MDEPKIVTLEQKDLDALVAKLGTQAQEKLNTLMSEAEKGNKEAIAELKANIASIGTIEGKSIGEFAKALQEQVNAIEAKTNKPLEFTGAKKSFEQSLRESIKAFGFEKIQESVKAGHGIPMEIKTAIDHSIVDSVGAGVIQSVFEPGITPILKRKPTLYQLLPPIPWSAATVNWVEINAEEGTIAAKKEAAASYAGNYDAFSKFPQRSYTVHKKSMDLSKIPAYAKVTQEMVENIDDFVQFIKSELLVDLLLQYDNDMLKGNGTAPNMKGLQHADYYTAAAIPDGFTLPSGITPSEVHILRAIVTQMQNLYCNPSFILMHPTDLMKMDLAVDKNGQFLLPPFAGRGNTEVKGVPIYEHSHLTEGTFHVIDATKPKHYIQRGVNLRMWDQVGNDPLYDLMTVTASIKGGIRVKTNEKGGNIYGDFATLIAAMTAGS